MEMRYLGRSGLQVSSLGFGAMSFGDSARAGYFKHLGVIEQDHADRLTAIAIEGGVTLFDTADIYSSGSSEEVLGPHGTRRA